MSEYNIPVLVKWFAKSPNSWNDKMCAYMGTVIMCREYGDELFRGPKQVNYGGWAWRHEYVIPNPTPSQIAEEARKAGKATVTTKPLVDPMTVDWPKSEFKVGMEVMFRHREHTRARRLKFDLNAAYKIIEDDGSDVANWYIDSPIRVRCCFDSCDLVPLSKIREYEAAQSAQKGPMEPKQVTKQIKETIAAKALREAMDKVKADQERVDGLKAIVALEAKQRENREQAKAISSEIATLSKKWLKGVGK